MVTARGLTKNKLLITTLWSDSTEREDKILVMPLRADFDGMIFAYNCCM